MIHDDAAQSSSADTSHIFCKNAAKRTFNWRPLVQSMH